MDFKEFINYLNNRLFARRKQLTTSQVGRYYEYVNSIDLQGLISTFANSMSDYDKLKDSVNESAENMYDTKLDTIISHEQLINITKSFFKDMDKSFFKRIEGILDGTDKRFKLKIDQKCNNKESSRVSNPNRFPITIEINEYGDLRDVYSLVHELTHCLDIDKGDNDTRKVLGEVAPRYMERLLDCYLKKNCDIFSLNKDVILRDIEIHKYASFLADCANAINFSNEQSNNSKDSLTKNQIIDARYVIALLCSSELEENDLEQSKKELCKFIRLVNNDKFYDASCVFKINTNSINLPNLISKTLKIHDEYQNFLNDSISKTIFDLLSTYEQKDKEKIDYIRTVISEHQDWDTTLPSLKRSDTPPELLALLMYEYSMGLENLSGVSYIDIVDKMSLIMGKMRFGEWHPNDDIVKYDGISVTDANYRGKFIDANGKEKRGIGTTFGAQVVTFIEDEKFQKACIAYDGRTGNGIDLYDINDLRHTFFHEWTHIMELDKVADKDKKIAPTVFQSGNRIFENNVLQENGEIWGSGLTTIEYGDNASNYAEYPDEKGRLRIMHNQITEGMVEQIALKLLDRVITDPNASKSIDRTRYFQNAKVAQHIMETFGEKETIATFITHSQQLISRLEEITVNDRDALHYMSDFVNDERCMQLIPEYSKRTNFFKRGKHSTIPSKGEKLAGIVSRVLNVSHREVKDGFEKSEIQGDSVGRLQNIFINYGLRLQDKNEQDEFRKLILDYEALIKYEKEFYDTLHENLICDDREQSKRHEKSLEINRKKNGEVEH